MPRGPYGSYVLLWLLVGAGVFFARRTGAIPFPNVAFLILAAVYFLGALWIVRQRHGGTRLFGRVAKAALIASGVAVCVLYLKPDGFPYTIPTRPRWFIDATEIVFLVGVACPPLFLLLGGILPVDMSRTTGDRRSEKR